MNEQSNKNDIQTYDGNGYYSDQGDTNESARPRRMSDISVKKNKKPIPRARAFFVFSHTNR